MDKTWSDRAWDDYLWWLEQDRRVVRRINRLIKEIERSGATGKTLGKSEVLTGSRNGLRSVRIDHANRLVYKFEDAEHLSIVSCRGHYE